MYRGFNVSLPDWYNNHCYIEGKKQYDLIKTHISGSLEHYVSKDGVMDGGEIQSDWFPPVEADIFISHSHKNEKKAIALSGWLSETFGLKVFIDSCIWGNSAELLQILDKNFCEKEENLYSYELRNHSTAHVHVMLSTALNMMIDKSESLFFLNTPDSIKTSDLIGEGNDETRTQSPWIYSELVMSRLIKKRSKEYYRPEIKKGRTKLYGVDESVKIKIDYPADLDHLEGLNENDFANWKDKWKNDSPQEKYPLDKLYTMKPLRKII